MKGLKKFLYQKMSARSPTREESYTEKDPLLRPERNQQSTISASDPIEDEVSSSSGGPDGVRSWIVGLALMTITMLMSGQARVASILFLDFRRVFQVNREVASRPYSVKMAGKNLCGPLAGILGQKYGVMAVVMSGGIISAISSMLCYFVMDISWIYFSVGFYRR
ncbi:monocarboxylate transporter 13-like [Uloborus diversus]|uniref:monocarboxylate transporter 13-like n=1 Tax=Uloborus diversus TaxID=327109 RepID=UPI00240A21AA|nr:monocarboxylate transporter 13-like [Uloborus diversus]